MARMQIDTRKFNWLRAGLVVVMAVVYVVFDGGRTYFMVTALLLLALIVLAPRLFSWKETEREQERYD